MPIMPPTTHIVIWNLFFFYYFHLSVNATHRLYQVCPSCRAFFRRSVQSGYNDSFKCTQGRAECEVTLVTRKNCQYCRYPLPLLKSEYF